MNTTGPCRCGHHKAVPVLVILIGLVFLLQYFNVVSAGLAAVSWPILLILAGIAKIGGGSCKCYAQPSM